MSTPDRSDLSDLRSRLSRPDRPDLPPLPDLTGLTHAYGDAADTVEHLRTLTLPPSQRRYRELNLHLVSAVIHQETLYPVTVPVTEYLMDLAEADALTGPGRAVVRDYLGYLLESLEPPFDGQLQDDFDDAGAAAFLDRAKRVKATLEDTTTGTDDDFLSEDSDLGSLLSRYRVFGNLGLFGHPGARDESGELALTEQRIRDTGIVATLREHPEDVTETLYLLRKYRARTSVTLLERLRDAAQPFLASPEKDPVDADLWALEDRYLFHTTDRAGVLKALSERK